MSEGSGVQVEIVTPTKITKVSSTTYQNAAITSGVSDVLIRIASVNEVSGEGALAGVYALLDKVGFSVDKKTIKTSQDEIGLIDKIKEEQIPVVFHTELSNEQMTDSICEATGAKKLLLHSCHNVSKDDFESGATYLSLMEQNVSALKEALN